MKNEEFKKGEIVIYKAKGGPFPWVIGALMRLQGGRLPLETRNLGDIVYNL